MNHRTPHHCFNQGDFFSNQRTVGSRDVNQNLGVAHTILRRAMDQSIREHASSFLKPIEKFVAFLHPLVTLHGPSEKFLNGVFAELEVF